VCMLSGKGASAFADASDENVFVLAAPSTTAVVLYQITRTGSSYTVCTSIVTNTTHQPIEHDGCDI